MVAGMGAVFVFLTLLVVATVVMSRLVLRLQPAGGEHDAASLSAEEEEVAVITAAITRYRNDR